MKVGLGVAAATVARVGAGSLTFVGIVRPKAGEATPLAITLTE